MRGLMAVAGVLVLAGCAQLQNVTVDEIRNPEYQRTEGEIAKTIPQIQRAMYDYGASCRNIGQLAIDPSNSGRATYATFMPGITDASAALLIDLQEAGPNTKYQGYTYYSTWAKRIEDAVYAMSGGKDCRR